MHRRGPRTILTFSFLVGDLRVTPETAPIEDGYIPATQLSTGDIQADLWLEAALGLAQWFSGGNGTC